jgi:branched-chain amino acid transport system substrate-binding protein
LATCSTTVACSTAVLIAEGIRTAQAETGKKVITGEDLRLGFEKFDLSEARLKEIGLEGFTSPIKASCADHEGGGAVFIQQWDGKDWKRVSDLIPPMTDAVRPLLEKAAEDYLKDKPNWQTQSCS